MIDGMPGPTAGVKVSSVVPAVSLPHLNSKKSVNEVLFAK
jgi:hypothetical protein